MSSKKSSKKNKSNSKQDDLNDDLENNDVTKVEKDDKEVDNNASNSDIKAKEEVVFKDSKSKTKAKTKGKNKKNKKDEEIDANKEKDEEKEEDAVNISSYEEPLDDESKKTPKIKHKKRIVIIIVIILVILAIAFAFSTLFALVHKTKDTIANGVSIKGIDVSGLTYSKAKETLEDYFDDALDITIELDKDDFSYIIAPSDISLGYSLANALDEAFSIGRSDGLFKNNYLLLYTAVNGKDIDASFTYDQDALNTILQYTETNIPGLMEEYSYEIDGDELVIYPGINGIKVNEDELKEKIDNTIQDRNLLLLDNSEFKIDIPCSVENAPEIDIEKIHDEIYTEPQDAYYIEETSTTEFEIHEDIDGVDFAISIDEAKEIISEPDLEEYIIPLKITKASVTINDLGMKAFPYLVSTYQTTYDASYTSRSKNLQIAASKIDGTVLMPGEQFSFNKVVGKRTVSAGYQDAKMYEAGQVVDGLAGGICQISSTLYNAALLANLQIDERSNHAFTTSYIQAGRDATVVYGSIDLKFTNTRKYPIKITSSVANGVATFSIYGIKEDNEYTVKIIPTTLSTTPYQTQTISDSSLTPGSEVVTQNGANGCTVSTRKEVYLGNTLISSTVISNDTYQPLTKIIKVGPSAKKETTSTNTSTNTNTNSSTNKTTEKKEEEASTNDDEDDEQEENP